MARHPQHATASVWRREAAAGFTLVEILVVIAIIGILLSIVFKGGSALVENARKRDTEALLNKLNLALDEYRREVDTSRIPYAKNIFNGAPPDDLRVFYGTTVTVGGCPVQMRNTGAILQNGTPVSANALVDSRNTSTGQLSDPTAPLIHGDIRAMVLGIRLNSPKANAILKSIDPKYWASPEQVNGYEFAADPTSNDPTTRIPLDFLLDGWGRPLEYFSTCICRDVSSLTPRDRVSNAFVHVNNDGPILVSYGADGDEQFAADRLASEGDTSSVVADYFPDNLMNSPFNSDNVYSSDFFTNRIRQAAP